MSYPQLSRIADPPTREALRLLFAWQQRWQAQEGGLHAPATLSLQGAPLTELGDPVEEGDAISLGYAEATYGSAMIRNALQVGGDAPLNVTGLVGVLANPQAMGIRVIPATDTALPNVVTARAYEVVTWQGKLYYFAPSTNPGTWVPLSAAASLESGVHSARPAATARSLGAIFWETDRLHLFYVISSGGVYVWKLLEGTGPMQGTLSPDLKPADLGTNDGGFLFYSTDFTRAYRWSGAAWADAPGVETRGSIQFFPITLHADFTPGAGWALCDGTAGVARSTPTGGTTTVTVPDLTTANRFVRSVAGTTGGTGGNATTHTHSIDPPVTTSSTPSNTLNVTVGAVAVASDGHTHTTDIAAFASAVPSGSSGDDALPPYYNLRPYIRL